jgi:hypothetical protein
MSQLEMILPRLRFGVVPFKAVEIRTTASSGVERISEGSGEGLVATQAPPAENTASEGDIDGIERNSLFVSGQEGFRKAVSRVGGMIVEKRGSAGHFENYRNWGMELDRDIV